MLAGDVACVRIGLARVPKGPAHPPGSIVAHHGFAIVGAAPGAYGRGRVPWLALRHPPDRARSPAGAGDGRPALRRRQGPPGGAQRLRHPPQPPRPRRLRRHPRRAAVRARRGRPRVRPRGGLPLHGPGARPRCRPTRTCGPVASTSSPRCARPPAASAPARWCCRPASAIPLGDRPVTVGRLAECTIPLNDQNVSRRHAEIRPGRGTYVVADLGSTNGTMVNGTRISGEQRLADGDILSFGSTYVRFEAS